MYVRVTRLRAAGRRLPRKDGPADFEGYLTIGPGNRSLVASVRRPLTMSSPPLATLFDVRLTNAGQHRLVLRGVEEHQGAA